jgi:hypothetical protein
MLAARACQTILGRAIKIVPPDKVRCVLVYHLFVFNAGQKFQARYYENLCGVLY